MDYHNLTGQETMINKKIASEVAVGIILIIAVAIGGIFWMEGKKENLVISNQAIQKPIEEKRVVCTQEVKLCDDGKTYVSRTGPNCEFALCSDLINDKNIVIDGLSVIKSTVVISPNNLKIAFIASLDPNDQKYLAGDFILNTKKITIFTSDIDYKNPVEIFNTKELESLHDLKWNSDGSGITFVVEPVPGQGISGTANKETYFTHTFSCDFNGKNLKDITVRD